MFKKTRLIFDFISNMGWRYVWFRVGYTLRTKTGLLKRKFPASVAPLQGLSLEAWRRDTPAFFFSGKNIPGLERMPSERLKQTFEQIQKGSYTFFSYRTYTVADGAEGWHTNPDTGYRYDATKHWTEIPDLSKEAGDIKFVWEKARFSFLYDVIRYDYHHGVDCADFVFGQIDSFIEHNPLNLGPQYKCSQETSLRILNWTFALYYYRDSEELTEERFRKIMQSIYGQLHHVYHNIHFSRIAVRNNHAITETLMLYLSGLLFPFMPETAEWSRKGKKWFEEEIAYQIYEDGTFLQYSMNYHRVVVQLLTWGLRLAELHGQRFADVVYDRAKKSLRFLDVCMDPVSGQLPNYGANDGALFFRLTDDDYRVYTSQLNDLRMVLHGTVSRPEESIHWYGYGEAPLGELDTDGTYAFPQGGYYIAQEENTKTFIRCGAYKDRPSQSDNLHLDVWVDGVNYLWDTGSYKYNTADHWLKYFNGVGGHNTVSVDGHDQMHKGGRFIWFYWVKDAKGKWKLTHDGENDAILFEGEIKGFRHLGGIAHERKVYKRKSTLEWVVTDELGGKGNWPMQQYWHINPVVQDLIKITAVDADGNSLEPLKETKWYSRYYGTKQDSIR
ncbi:MAG: alginate lyase family protein, partial [Spirosomataceae bacterium]